MKISLLGAAGGIGQALALLLKLQLPAGTTLALYDVAPVISGVALDLSHIPTTVAINSYSGDNLTAALQNADIVIIAAGTARKPGMERTDLLAVNAAIVETLIQKIATTAPHSLIGIITNPVNTVVVIAAEILKRAQIYDRNKLFGITTLDTIRANTFVAELTGIPPETVAVPVVGGHSGVTILPLFSQVKGITFTEQQIVALTQRIQHAGTEVVNAKAGNGSATLAMAHAGACFTLSLVRALQGEQGISVQAYVESDGPYSRFFAQPLLLGMSGIAKRCDIGPLSPFEQHALEGMLATLRAEISMGEQLAKDHRLQ